MSTTITSISLKARDVGFCLRLIGMAVQLPPGVTQVDYDGGEATGTVKEITQQLRDAGFVVGDPQR